jgi:hypothetical protein
VIVTAETTSFAATMLTAIDAASVAEVKVVKTLYTARVTIAFLGIVSPQPWAAMVRDAEVKEGLKVHLPCPILYPWVRLFFFVGSALFAFTRSELLKEAKAGEESATNNARNSPINLFICKSPT